jgi:hypothetical protein
MRVVLIILFALIYHIDGHNQHGNPGGHGQPPNEQPAHVTRKMEEYVHDMEYENFFFRFFYLLNIFIVY